MNKGLKAEIHPEDDKEMLWRAQGRAGNVLMKGEAKMLHRSWNRRMEARVWTPCDFGREL